MCSEGIQEELRASNSRIILEHALGNVECDKEPVATMASVLQTLQEIENTKYQNAGPPPSNKAEPPCMTPDLDISKFSPELKKSGEEMVNEGLVTDVKFRVRSVWRHNVRGCCMLVQTFLLPLLPHLSASPWFVGGLPGFSITGTPPARGDIINYLLVCVDEKYKHLLLHDTEFALHPEGRVTHAFHCFVAVTGTFYQYLARAFAEVAAYSGLCGQSIGRGCLTSGEEWIFFICETSSSGPVKGHYSDIIKLGESMENLSLIFGLLKDWVPNAKTGCASFISCTSSTEDGAAP